MNDPNRPVTGYPAPNQGPQPPPPGGGGYAYVAAPPYYNQHPPQYDSYNPQRATCLRRFFAIIIASVVITGSIVFIIWLVLRPRYPQFRVDSFSVTAPFNLTANHLSTSWDVALTARNPNGKINLYYDEIRAAVFYGGDSLADTSLAPFTQGKKEESQLKSSFVASDTFVDPGDVDGMNEEMRKGNGSLRFGVWVVADVRFRAGIWRKRRFLKVYCGDLVVSVAGNGSRGDGFTGGPRQCQVGL